MYIYMRRYQSLSITARRTSLHHGSNNVAPDTCSHTGVDLGQEQHRCSNWSHQWFSVICECCLNHFLEETVCDEPVGPPASSVHWPHLPGIPWVGVGTQLHEWRLVVARVLGPRVQAQGRSYMVTCVHCDWKRSCAIFEGLVQVVEIDCPWPLHLCAKRPIIETHEANHCRMWRYVNCSVPAALQLCVLQLFVARVWEKLW